MKKDLEWLKNKLGVEMATLTISGGLSADRAHQAMDRICLLLDKTDFAQRPTPPVIPEFAAEYIEDKKKKRLGLRFVFWSIEQMHVNGRYMDKCQMWIYNNGELFARAWIDGYVVREVKYFVLNKSGRVILATKEGGEVIEVGSVDFCKLATGDYSNELTEREIKEYDERYWAFAVPVEE